MAESSSLGLFLLSLVLVPGERVPLHIFEPRYRQLFADCVLDDAPFVVLYADGGAPAPVGCTARFEELLERHDDGRISVVVRGLAPVEVLRGTHGHPYDSAECRALADDPVRVDPERVHAAQTRFAELAELATGTAEIPEHDADTPWSYAIAARVELSARVKQTLLETRDENVRLDLLTRALEAELAAHRRARLAAERAPTNGKVPHD